MTPGASRHTHALDATIAKALAPFFPLRPLAIPLATAAVRDALLAEGHITSWYGSAAAGNAPRYAKAPALVIPLGDAS